MSKLEELLSNIDRNELVHAIESVFSRSKLPELQPATLKRKQPDDMPTHALIFWHKENKYTTLNYKNIELGDDLVVEIDKIYNIKFNSSTHEGKVVLVGSKADCEKHYELINEQQNLDDQPKSSNEENVIKKVTKKESTEIQMLKNKQTQLNDEISILRIKLEEFQRNQKEFKQKENDLLSQLKIANEKIDILSNTFSECYFFF